MLMNKLFSIPKVITNILSKIWPILWIIFLASQYILVYQLYLKGYSLVPYVFISVLVSIISIFIYRKYSVIKRVNYFIYIVSFIISFYISYSFVSNMTLKDVMNIKWRLISLAADFYLVFVIVTLILSFLSKYCFVNEFKNTHFFQSLIYGLTISFVIYYYVPAETFFASFQDYNYPYWLLFKAFLLKFIFLTFVITILTGLLNKKFYSPVRALQTGLLISIYIQYMFMNSSVKSMDGTGYLLKDHIIEAIINSAVWLILLFAPLLISIKKKDTMIKLSAYITAAIGAIHLISYAGLLLGANKSCFQYASTYYDFSEQFRVGSNNNIIVLIIDAADNSYINELSDKNDEILDEYKDFTIYTNTCSVYDYTNLSQLQMVTNFPFDNNMSNSERRKLAWNTPWAKEFFKRFHEAGYRVNFYNFDYETSEYVVGNIDNAKKLNPDDVGIQYINYKKIRFKNDEIIRYRIFPVALKGCVTMYNVADPEPVVVFNTSNGVYDNEDFYKNANIELGDNENYVIFNHIIGVHAPNDNADSLKDCLEITDKYIDGLKNLGVYDNATIIVTSDHGMHERGDATVAEPATPIFMIKEAGVINNEPKYNNAPICHSDFMATLLYNAGLYNGEKKAIDIISSSSITDGYNTIEELIPNYNIQEENEEEFYSLILEKDLTDAELFGYPVEFYDEDDIRYRQWFDRIYDKSRPKISRYYNVFYGFSYCGDTDEFNRCVNDSDGLKVYPFSVNFE